MKPSILILGKNGQVGYELNLRLAHLGNLIVLGSQDADFTSPDSVVKVLEKHQPDIIINAAAHTAVDKAETESELAYLVNAQTPGKIADFAKTTNSLFVHYSTDFVFDGMHDKAYLETDKTNPLGVYGASKLAGEKLIQQSACKHLIFRTSWVYGKRGNNFLLTMLRLAHNLEQMKVVNDQIGSPVWCGYIAQTTATVLEQLINTYHLSEIPESIFGIYNLTARNYTSWHGFAKKILELDPDRSMQTCKSVLAIPSIEYPTPAQRPKWSVLDNLKLQQTFSIDVPNWEKQLIECFNS